MLFSVNYINDSGSKKNIVLTANSEADIVNHPAFSGSLVSITKYPEFLQGVLIKKLKLDSQLLLLSQVYTLVDSGGELSMLKEIITSMPDLVHVKNDPRLRHAARVSEYLEMCGVDNITMMIVKAGEESGRQVEAVQDAVLDIEKRIELSQATKGDVSKGIFYVIAGLGMLFGMSNILSGIIVQMTEGGRFTPNAGSDSLLTIHSLVSDKLFMTLLVTVSAITMLRVLWVKSAFFRDIPFVKSLNNYRKVVRSLSFITVWRPLYLSGIPMTDALNQIKSGMTGMDKTAVEDLISQVTQGKSIANSLNKDYWSIAFRIGMKPFDSATEDSKRQLLIRIQSLLITEMVTLGKRLGKQMLIIGSSLGLTAVLLMAFGFYLPMIAGLKLH